MTPSSAPLSLGEGRVEGNSRIAWIALGAAGLVALGLLAYDYALGVPLLLDDVIQIRWVREHSLAQIWSANLISYFRPLQFTAWKALTPGEPNIPLLHAVNIILHAVCGALAFVVFRLRAPSIQTVPQLLAPIAAGVLFLLYPFSYQVVPWVGSLGHPLALALMLVSLALGLMARAWALMSLKIASLGLAVVAPFAHESGVLIAPLLTLLLLTDESDPRFTALRSRIAFTLPYWLISLSCAAIVFGMNRAMGNRSTLDLLAESRLQNAAYFLQGFAYPVAPLATALQRAIPAISDVQSVWLVCLPVVVALSVLFWRKGGRHLVTLSASWYVIGVLPAWLLLDFSYVVDGPRLMYEAAPGAALFWCIPLALAWSGNARIVAPMMAGALSLSIAFGSAAFLSERADMYRQAGALTTQLARAIPPSETTTTVLVNFPQWLAPRQNTFPVGHEGVSIIAQYTSVYDYLLANTGRVAYVETAVVEDVKRPWRHNYAPFGPVRSLEDMQGRIRVATRTLMTDYAIPNAAVYDAGGLTAQGAALPDDFVALYGEQLALVDAACKLEGTTLIADLTWQTTQPIARELSTFVHVLTPTGALAAQTDGLPVGNLSRFTAWQPGDRWREARRVPLPVDARGAFSVHAGAYPAGGGDRLAATRPDGQRHPNDSALVCRISLP
jgi:hypothetical protein